MNPYSLRIPPRWQSILTSHEAGISNEATVLLYLTGIDPFLEDLAKSADQVFYFEEGPRDTPRLSAKTWLKMKGKLHIHGCKKCALANSALCG
jgi:hypothetical protein